MRVNYKKIIVMAYSETEQKIIVAARKVFRQKGLEASRTRLIAEEAGVNLALINYYFRSKQELYNVVMKEAVHEFGDSVLAIINNPKTDIATKVTKISAHYTKIISNDPDLLHFVFANKDHLSSLVNVPQGTMNHTVLMKQLQERGLSVHEAQQICVNCMALVLFPFFAMPLWQHVFALSDVDCTHINRYRQSMVPIWIEKMITKQE